jgi:maleate cis-trans isomerase
MIRRRKFGILVPSSNVTLEYEMPIMAPKGCIIAF